MALLATGYSKPQLIAYLASQHAADRGEGGGRRG